MNKETAYNLRLAVNGIVIYVLSVFFHNNGKIKTQNMKIVFVVLGFWFLYMTWRFFRQYFLVKKSRMRLDYVTLGISVLNSLLYVLGAFGLYYGAR